MIGIYTLDLEIRSGYDSPTLIQELESIFLKDLQPKEIFTLSREPRRCEVIPRPNNFKLHIEVQTLKKLQEIEKKLAETRYVYL